MTRRVKLSEADIKRACEDWLTVKQNMGELVFLRLNEGQFITQSGRWAKGCQKGTSDLLVIINNGRYDSPIKFHAIPIFIECKSSKGRQNNEQKEFQERVESQGAEYHIVKDVSELIKIMEGR
jgi:hypothetical protein